MHTSPRNGVAMGCAAAPTQAAERKRRHRVPVQEYADATLELGSGQPAE